MTLVLPLMISKILFVVSLQFNYYIVITFVDDSSRYIIGNDAVYPTSVVLLMFITFMEFLLIYYT